MPERTEQPGNGAQGYDPDAVIKDEIANPIPGPYAERPPNGTGQSRLPLRCDGRLDHVGDPQVSLRCPIMPYKLPRHKED